LTSVPVSASCGRPCSRAEPSAPLKIAPSSGPASIEPVMTSSRSPLAASSSRHSS
jgi:hypothetical protein